MCDEWRITASGKTYMGINTHSTISFAAGGESEMKNLHLFVDVKDYDIKRHRIFAFHFPGGQQKKNKKTVIGDKS